MTETPARPHAASAPAKERATARSLAHRLFAAPPGVDERSYRTLVVVCLLGTPAHAAYILLFVALGVWPLVWFNVLSVALWATALLLMRRGALYAALYLIDAEVMVHAVLSVVFVGWLAGFQQYLITNAVCAFIPPGRRRINSAVAFLASLLYIVLYVYAGAVRPADTPLGVGAGYALFALNTALALIVSSAAFAYYMSRLERAEAALQAEHAKSEALLRNTLPVPIVERLKRDGTTIADGYASASVLFADIANFTPLSQAMAPKEVVEMLDHLFSCFDDLVARHGLEKIKTVGDAYMVAAGIPVPRPDHADAIARFALDLEREVERYNHAHGTRLRLRIGINSGPVVAGVIGRLRFLYDLWGDAVNTASRMESHGVPGAIQVTEETRRLLGDRFTLEERGTIDVKGKGPMRTYFLRRGAQVPEGA